MLLPFINKTVSETACVNPFHPSIHASLLIAFQALFSHLIPLLPPYLASDLLLQITLMAPV